MNELNEKMIRFAGFRHIKAVYCVHCKRWEQEYWLVEGIGKRIYKPDLPIFPLSLDACFKWLVPKLRRDFSWSVDIGFSDSTVFNLDRTVDRVEWAVTLYLMKSKEYCGEAETPTLALCKAIEQLKEQA